MVWLASTARSPTCSLLYEGSESVPSADLLAASLPSSGKIETLSTATHTVVTSGTTVMHRVIHQCRDRLPLETLHTPPMHALLTSSVASSLPCRHASACFTASLRLLCVSPRATAVRHKGGGRHPSHRVHYPSRPSKLCQKLRDTDPANEVPCRFSPPSRLHHLCWAVAARLSTRDLVLQLPSPARHRHWSLAPGLHLCQAVQPRPPPRHAQRRAGTMKTTSRRVANTWHHGVRHGHDGHQNGRCRRHSSRRDTARGPDQGTT